MNCCSASVTGLILSHCVSHCSGGSTGEDSAPASDHTYYLLRQTASHTVSLRQVGNWIAANPASDLHMSFSMQEKKKVCVCVKRVVFCSSKKLNSWFSDYSHHLINAFIMCSFFIL